MKIRILTLAFVSLLIACGSSTAPVVDQQFTMRFLNEVSLPAQVVGIDYANVDQYWVMAGTLTLRGNKTYNETLDIQFRQSSLLVSSYQTSENGTYAIQGNGITFTTPDYSYTGTIDGNVLRYSTSSDLWRAYYTSP